MTEFKKPLSEEEFKDNFAIKEPLMNATEAYFESSRCLFCYDAPCIKACPTGIDIPLFIKQIHTNNTKGAAKTIYEANWLGNACGKICPTSVLCEGACVYNHSNVPPIQIGRLQNYATNKSISENTVHFTPGKANGNKVAIIGSGPAGIACACELRTMGHEVDIYEKKDKPSGLTLFGIAAYKINNEEVLDEVNYLKDQLGLNFILNTPIDSVENIEMLEKNYQAIFIGVGLGATRSIGLPGEDKQNVIGAVEFIEKLRRKHHRITVGKKVVVIGGGNTAMDAASQAARMGAQTVTLAYRRSKESMGAYSFEYDLAIKAGVDPLFNVQPLEILGEEATSGIKFNKTKSLNGELSTVDNSSFEMEADMIIVAAGQTKQTDWVKQIMHIDLNKKNHIVVNDSFQTTNPMYFAGGDAVNGGAEVVNAAYEGKKAAQGIDSWLNKLSNKNL